MRSSPPADAARMSRHPDSRDHRAAIGGSGEWQVAPSHPEHGPTATTGGSIGLTPAAARSTRTGGFAVTYGAKLLVRICNRDRLRCDVRGDWTRNTRAARSDDKPLQ